MIERSANRQESNLSVLIVTGLSGAGISSTLHILQDFGCETVDNLPAHLIEVVVEARSSPMAIAIDVRNRNFDPQAVLSTLNEVRCNIGDALSMLYIDCIDDELIQRFSRTKRTHPMARDIRLMDGIAQERELLSVLLSAADYRIDTTGQSIWQHRQRLLGLGLTVPRKKMRIRVISFSYGRGIPRDADLVLDVRFLRNPHYESTLRERNGTDTAVSDYVAQDEIYPAFFDALSNLLSVTLERYQLEGKSYLSLAFGCTGGQHRSVAVAEIVAQKLRHEKYHIQIFHRELPQNAD
ncbi:MAG: RNase adapter RapZ [Alphaproteobacteria bacterium]|nr:RNase adapter RapZ [Alphaproteobacteria bacterium]